MSPIAAPEVLKTHVLSPIDISIGLYQELAIAGGVRAVPKVSVLVFKPSSLIILEEAVPPSCGIYKLFLKKSYF